MRMPAYEPKTEHFFHGGMYCRKVFRDKDVMVVGRVHRKEHFYLIVSGSVLITDGSDEAVRAVAGTLILSKPGTERAVFSLEPTVCMTFHRTDATTVEEAEAELVEPDDCSMYGIGNATKVLT